MNSFIYISGLCPKCGCRDIRADWFGYKCFKCGYTEYYKPGKFYEEEKNET